MEQVPLKVHEFQEGSTKKEHHNKQTRTHPLTSCYPLIGPSKEIKYCYHGYPILSLFAHPRYTRYSNFKSRVGSLAPTHSHLEIIAGCIASPPTQHVFYSPRRWHKGATVLQVARWKLFCCFIFCKKITLSAVLGSVKCQDPSNWTDLLD